MKIIIFGDAAHTGFGTVTANLGLRFLAAGHDVRFINNNLTPEPIGEPMGSRTWNLDFIAPDDVSQVVAKGFRDGWTGDVALVMRDFGAARQLIDGAGAEAAKRWNAVPTFHYMPVEGVDLPPTWTELWRRIIPVAMTHSGADEIERITGERPPVIYHGVDHKTFHPVSAETPIRLGSEIVITSKAEAKANFGIDPEHIVLLRTDRYMPRKEYNAMLRAVEPILDERDDVDLVIHAQPNDHGGSLRDSKFKMTARAQRHVFITGATDTFRGLNVDTLAALYNAGDIYLNTGAEGFGLAVAESMACGVPVVGMAFSALPEVVGPGGVLVPISHLIDNIYNHSWACVDEVAYTAALRTLIDDQVTRVRLGKLATAHVKRFDWDVAAAQFLALFEGVV